MPKLFVIMASAAPVAIVLRRGPSSWSHLIAWDTDTDTFTKGAWFRGRIYAEKCDLSPNGKLFVYAAFQGAKLRTTYSDSWTAISRPPWLHALALWPMGTTYGGGGRFVDDLHLMLRGASGTHPDHPLAGIEIVAGKADYHGSSEEVEDAEWSGRDQRNRVVFTRDGCIFARHGTRDTLLADLRDETPAPEPAPTWAQAPLAQMKGAKQPGTKKPGRKR